MFPAPDQRHNLSFTRTSWDPRPGEGTILGHCKHKDTEIQVHGYLAQTLNHSSVMGQSMFCLCPSRYEVASPRIDEFVHAGPVVISNISNSKLSMPFLSLCFLSLSF
ncbi:hypothetical protein VNO78_30399 [Psophocarpus tetragonolobus]|uniref:Uncharacterized protein n=1 Tax=Psophocarpus tetragonolobus TaxID=3891 RepID=A0AAN9RWH1_PSOTE